MGIFIILPNPPTFVQRNVMFLKPFLDNYVSSSGISAFRSNIPMNYH